MPNEIPQRQNDPRMIDNKSASSEVYLEGKYIATWQTRFALASAVGVPAMVTLFPQMHVYGAVYSVLTLLADVIFFEPAVKRKQKTGAKIQELFDTQVLQLPWNQARVGTPPDPETVVELAEKFKNNKNNDVSRLKDWYPVDVGQVPIEFARFICQRANMRWDSALRRNYCFLFIVMLFGIVGGGLVFGVAMGWGTDKFILSIILPLLPAGLKLYREMLKHDEAATATEDAKRHLEGVWKKAIDQHVPAIELEHDARRLQDELYDRRKNTPSVPEWLYSYYRADFETQMKAGAAYMIDQALAKLSPTGTVVTSAPVEASTP